MPIFERYPRFREGRENVGNDESSGRQQTCLISENIEKVYAAVHNMLTKYKMITFIDFCEVWFQPESVARVAVIAGNHRCHTHLGIDSKIHWMCSRGTADLADSTRYQI
ncbi:hypothetical protein TNCV_485721 [Trichonephila clavipes]|nr:hypothetical protein TNCV_485721 [Trichonephila clavipes]